MLTSNKTNSLSGRSYSLYSYSVGHLVGNDMAGATSNSSKGCCHHNCNISSMRAVHCMRHQMKHEKKPAAGGAVKGQQAKLPQNGIMLNLIVNCLDFLMVLCMVYLTGYFSEIQSKRVKERQKPLLSVKRHRQHSNHLQLYRIHSACRWIFVPSATHLYIQSLDKVFRTLHLLPVLPLCNIC